MTTSAMNKVIKHLHKDLFLQDAVGMTDGQLLERFISQRDEAAFEAIVRRHGPMVLGVCRRVLWNIHDAEDAFQAAFLVLIRKAASILPREKVANWLYGVAYQTALRAKVAATKRGSREKQVVILPEVESVQPDSCHDWLPMFDEALSHLPAKYRVPIVLCELEGKTHQEAARQLGVPIGTLSGRLSRARSMLAKHLARHGCVLPSSALTVVLSEKASATVGVSLLASTAKLAGLSGAGQGLLTSGISANILALSKGVLQAMFLTKVKIVTAVLLCITFVCAGAAFSNYLLSAEPGNERQAWNATQNLPASDPQPKAADNTKVQLPPDKPLNQQPPKKQPAHPPKVRALLEKRVDVLKQIAELLNKESQKGTVSQDRVLKANWEVFKAELDLCETDKQRIALHEKCVDMARILEEKALRLHKDGLGSLTEVLTAQVNRLEAEIALERARAKVDPQAK